jgi:hypothetical protein
VFPVLDGPWSTTLDWVSRSHTETYWNWPGCLDSTAIWAFCARDRMVCWDPVTLRTDVMTKKKMDPRYRSARTAAKWWAHPFCIATMVVPLLCLQCANFGALPMPPRSVSALRPAFGNVILRLLFSTPALIHRTNRR